MPNAKFDIPCSSQSVDIEQNSDGGISNLRISLVGFLTRETKQRQKNDSDVMLEICDVIAIFLIYGQFGAIQKPNSGCIVCKTYIVISNNLLSYKNWEQYKKIFNTALTRFLWLRVVF